MGRRDGNLGHWRSATLVYLKASHVVQISCETKLGQIVTPLLSPTLLLAMPQEFCKIFQHRGRYSYHGLLKPRLNKKNIKKKTNNSKNGT